MINFKQYLKLQENSVNDYGGDHRPADSETGSPLYDLTRNGVYPDDIYSSKAIIYYGHSGNYSDPLDRESISIIQRYKNKPNAPVTIYRAVPKEASNEEKIEKLVKDKQAYMRRGKIPKDSEFSNGSKWYEWASNEIERLKKAPEHQEANINEINSGDWVTISKIYAKDHGLHALNGKYKILTKKVKASQIFTDGNSIHEWGYWE